MSDNIENNYIFPEQKFDIVVTSSNNINPTQLPPAEMAHTQPEQVCIVITDPSQQKQQTNSIPSLPNVISYHNSFIPNLYYLGHDVSSVVSATSLSAESNISVVTPSKSDPPIFTNMSYIPTPPSQPQIAKKNQTRPFLGVHQDHLPSSTSSSETIGEKMSDLTGPDYRNKTIDKTLKVMEQLMKQSIKINKQTLRSQMRMEHYLQQVLKNSADQPVFANSNRAFQLQRGVTESQPPHLFRYSSQPDNTAILATVESSSPSESPPNYTENRKEGSLSNLTIDLGCPILLDAVGQRSPHKYHSHSCSMYNKSIRDFSDPDTNQWLEQILPILGSEVTLEKIQEVLSQTNTITHFTAEFQKVVFTNNERKTLTTSGKFRKRKLERIVLGPLDTAKLQGIIQLSLYLFGVTEKDEERVKYQLKQAIDEKNRREFYREDRGTKRIHLSSIPN